MRFEKLLRRKKVWLTKNYIKNKYREDLFYYFIFFFFIASQVLIPLLYFHLEVLISWIDFYAKFLIICSNFVVHQLFFSCKSYFLIFICIFIIIDLKFLWMEEFFYFIFVLINFFIYWVQLDLLPNKKTIFIIILWSKCF